MHRLTGAWSVVVLLGIFTVLPVAGAAEGGGEYRPPEELPEGWYARIETSKGRIVARLLPEQAPQSVAHFAALAQGRFEWTDPITGEELVEPYYDGIAVHRAEAGRVFEVGDRHGSGHGAPRVYVPEEGAGPVSFHGAYRLGLTRSSGRRISGVMFFVTVSAQPWLTPRHPCFGEIVSGRDVAFDITSVRTYGNGRPMEPITIEKLRVFKVGAPGPLPEPEPYTPQPLELEMRKPGSGGGVRMNSDKEKGDAAGDVP